MFIIPTGYQALTCTVSCYWPLSSQLQLPWGRETDLIKAVPFSCMTHFLSPSLCFPPTPLTCLTLSPSPSPSPCFPSPPLFVTHFLCATLRWAGSSFTTNTPSLVPTEKKNIGTWRNRRGRRRGGGVSVKKVEHSCGVMVTYLWRA